MKKEDMNTIELFAEAIGMIALAAYIGLQIYYGIYYKVPVNFFINIAVMLLVYTGLSLMQCHPHRVNRLTKTACTGDIRKYTIRMVRIIKFIFLMSLLFTSILDVMGQEINAGYSLGAVVLSVAAVLYYEYKIYTIIKKNSDQH